MRNECKGRLEDRESDLPDERQREERAETSRQLGGVSVLAGRISEIAQIGAGFALMGASLGSFILARTPFSVFALVGLLAMGSAFVSPNLAALISKRSGHRRTGVALGVQNAANSLGQASGPLLGGALFLWRVNAPYVLTGMLLVAVALAIGGHLMHGQRKAGVA